MTGVRSNIIQLARFSTCDLDQGVKITRHMKRIQSKLTSDKEKYDDLALSKYDEQIGQLQVQELVGRLPKLEATKLRAIPSEGAPFFIIESGARDTASKVCSWLDASSGHNISATLEDQWRRRHATITHDSSVAVPGQHKADTCYDRNWCLCTDAGKLLWKKRNALLRSMKDGFAPHPRGKRLLLQYGLAVARLEE
eukprot:48223-Pyramimonas_sp.AAC.1